MVFGEDPEGQLAPYNENLEECQNAKWDWYQLGGRWTGFFKAKDITQMSTGERGTFDNSPKDGYGDAMAKSNIDVEGMKEDYLLREGKKYDEIVSIINTWINANTVNNIRPIPKPWSYYRSIAESGRLPIDEVRASYKAQATYKFELGNAGYHFLDEDPIEDYWLKTKDSYLENSVKHCMVPYAYVKDGEWFGKGEMGWFGMSLYEIDQDEYLSAFWDTFNSLPEDTMVYLYDCHI
jgi:hypothetical protein